MSAIRDYRADAVITFDDDGLYWHLDHVGIHERTWDAVEALGADAPSLYFVTMPKGVIRQVFDAAIKRGWTPPASGPWAIVPDAFGLDAKPPTLVVDVGDWTSCGISLALAGSAPRFSAAIRYSYPVGRTRDRCRSAPQPACGAADR